VSIRTKRGKYREEPCDMEEEVGDVSVSQSVSLRSSESVGYFFFFRRTRAILPLFAPCICMYFDTHELGRNPEERISTDRVTEPTWLTCQPPNLLQVLLRALLRRDPAGLRRRPLTPLFHSAAGQCRAMPCHAVM
jgi:hypothetical protein